MHTSIKGWSSRGSGSAQVSGSPSPGTAGAAPPHLHLELRKSGRPVDPLGSWLALGARDAEPSPGTAAAADLAGVIIFGVLSMTMINKAYLAPQPIDRPEARGAFEEVEPLVRRIKGRDETKSVRLRVRGDDGFLMHPAIYQNQFDRDAFAKAAPLGTIVKLEVRAERLPVIFSLRAGGETFVDKAWVRALSGRLMFCACCAGACCGHCVCLFSLLRRRDEHDAT